MEAPLSLDERTRRNFYAAGSPASAVFRFERLDPPDYRVMEQFDYVDRLGRWYRVPANVEQNKTDFASIPAFLTWLVPKDGAHTPAAVLHDALIGGREGVDYLTSDGVQVSDRHADYLFREAMEASEVPWLRRWLMWAAVALRTLSVTFDGRGEERLRRPRIALIAAAVILWGLTAAAMALDVPDLLAADLPGWLDRFVVIGDRPVVEELALGVLLIAGGALVMMLVFGVVLGVGQGRDGVERAALAGLIAGGAIGFFALPMLASLVGAVGYFLIERLTSAWARGRAVSPAVASAGTPSEGAPSSGAPSTN